MPYMNWRGWGIPNGNIRPVSLDAAYHREQDYIWFRGGDLNVFGYIRHFMKLRGWGMQPLDPCKCN